MIEEIKKHAGGRPSEYQEKMPRIREYLFRYKQLDEVVPSIEGLADYVPMSRQTIYNWIEDQEKGEFLDIIERIFVQQGKLTLNLGLKGEFNSTIAKLLLSKHGYIEESKSHNFVSGELTEEQKKKWDEILLNKKSNEEAKRSSTGIDTEGDKGGT